jgi:virginiamycin B lyase
MMSFAPVVHVQAAPTITEYPIPTTGNGPTVITTGPDGALWFTEVGKYIGSATYAGGKIGRIDPGSKAVTEYAIPTANSAPVGIAAGPDQALWFTEQAGSKIGRITVSGVVTEYAVALHSSPTFIAAGPDGAMWFSQTVGQIGRITTGATPTVTEYNGGGDASGIAAGPDGAMWFTGGSSNTVGRIDVTTKVVTPYSLPNDYGRYPSAITAGPDGAMWFTEDYRIGRITTDGAHTITDYIIPIGAVLDIPSGIAAGPDNAMWFASSPYQSIKRVTMDAAHTFTAYPTPSGYNPYDLTAGPDGAMWFTESNGGIGRITVELPPTSPPLSLPASHIPGPALGPSTPAPVSLPARAASGPGLGASAPPPVPLPPSR